MCVQNVYNLASEFPQGMFGPTKFKRKCKEKKIKRKKQSKEKMKANRIKKKKLSQ